MLITEAWHGPWGEIHTWFVSLEFRWGRDLNLHSSSRDTIPFRWWPLSRQPGQTRDYTVRITRNKKQGFHQFYRSHAEGGVSPPPPPPPPPPLSHTHIHTRTRTHTHTSAHRQTPAHTHTSAHSHQNTRACTHTHTHRFILLRHKVYSRIFVARPV